MIKIPPRRTPILTTPITDGSSKIGGSTSTDRSAASPVPVATDVGSGYTRSTIDTYFTKDGPDRTGTPILYNADNNWARVTLTLETAGPVVVGQSAGLSPVLSGRGALLETDVPLTFTIAKGTKLYILSTGVNRVKRVIEPVPWLEQITGMMAKYFGFSTVASGKIR